MVRLKHRYLVVNVVDTKKSEPVYISDQCIWYTVMDKVRYLHGPFGDAATMQGLCIKYVNKHTGIVMIRARRGPHRLVASALPMITELKKAVGSENSSNISITTLYTGACIKQCMLFIKRYQMDEYNKAIVNLNDDDRQQLKETYMRCEFTE